MHAWWVRLLKNIVRFILKPAAVVSVFSLKSRRRKYNQNGETPYSDNLLIFLNLQMTVKARAVEKIVGATAIKCVTGCCVVLMAIVFLAI